MNVREVQYECEGSVVAEPDVMISEALHQAMIVWSISVLVDALCMHYIKLCLQAASLTPIYGDPGGEGGNGEQTGSGDCSSLAIAARPL